MEDRNIQRKWHGVYISEDFDIKELSSGNSFEEIIRQVNEPLQEANLPEENIETLLTAAFQRVFSNFDLMLIYRERPLFQMADLIAIDKIGRLTVLEIKKKKPKLVDIVAQATKYLIECANLNPTQIRRIFYNYCRQFRTFQILYYTGLLVRRGVERGTSKNVGLGKYLSQCQEITREEKERLKSLHQKGEERYFEYLKEMSIKYILSKYAPHIDLNSIVERIWRRVMGITSISLSELENIPQKADCFDKMFLKRFDTKPENVDINRQWRIIYFCPTYGFETEIRRYLTEMYRRGMDMHFYEYRLMAHSSQGPWLLGWSVREDWLDEKLLKKRIQNHDESTLYFSQRQLIKHFDDFTGKMEKEGCILKKWTGAYVIWEVIKPDLNGVEIEWPSPDIKKPDNLKRGIINFKKVPSTISKELGQLLKGLEHQYNVKIDFPEKDYLVVRWNASSVSLELCSEIASKVITELLRWYQGKLINETK